MGFPMGVPGVPKGVPGDIRFAKPFITGVAGDNRPEEDLVIPAFPKLLKERSFGLGDGVGAALRVGSVVGVDAVGLVTVGLAIEVPQNSCPSNASEVSSCLLWASWIDMGSPS